ncbi:uncharacterized protein EI90DRAFT_3038680 [Cantharellus anzutake]|uniref:uncharacterized protein n=1 Tax=Cantharellus anzutake TaxID=1750568 RepID=UPI0019060488|nr:uncharacterized protein EI90DRAFT_3038680 [Cantharellus anzutake]KAF8339975.1 hypothetical protein EI90DRAFT_3038680 [Cantharellus anzutake]
MLQAVKLSRRNRHQVPRQSPTLRHGGGLPRNTISPSGHDSYSHSETAFVDNPIARTDIAAPHPPYEEQLQLPFSIIPYCTPPTSITSTDAANFFVDYLRSYHPYVRRIVIETDDRSRSVSTLEGEAAQINMIGSMGHQAMVHISRCPRQAQFA